MLDESIFKAYDIRGVYPESLDEGVAEDIGRAFVKHLDLAGSRVIVARDMRISGEALENAFIQGVTQAGADVLDLGLVSTDALYFAVGHLEEPGGAMVTASHNPKDYNGFKLCREEAIALSGDAGLGQILDLIVSGDLPGPRPISRFRGGDRYHRRLCETLPELYTDGGPEAAEDRDRRGKRHGGQDGPTHLRAPPFRVRADVLRARRLLPQPSAEPDRTRERQGTPGARGRGGCRLRGMPSTATPTAASSSTRRARPSRATWPPPSSRRTCWRRSPARPSSTARSAPRRSPSSSSARAGKAIRTKAGHSIIKPQMRKNDAAFGGEHSGPLLLQGQLLRRLGHNRHAHHSRARRPPGRARLRGSSPPSTPTSARVRSTPK